MLILYFRNVYASSTIPISSNGSFQVETAHRAPYVAGRVSPEKRVKEVNVAIDQASAQLRDAVVIDLACVSAQFTE